MEDSYQSIYSSRYCKDSPLIKIFSEKNRIRTWRQLWVYLAQAQCELGIEQITQEKIKAMTQRIDDIDFAFARDAEKAKRHDVMAHIATFEKDCPQAAGILHLGATSCFVTDNADLMIIKQAATYTLERLAACLERLSAFAEKNAVTPTVGRTHYQAASITTVGKRACIWAQDLLIAFNELNYFLLRSMRFRSIKGATGTQDSFLSLFNSDANKVTSLERRVAELAGFEDRIFIICGQTYSRQLDAQLLNALALVGSAMSRICTDIRLLQSYGEIMEPFEEQQIGSSAMPYKRNPMRSERCCAFARYLMSLPINALNTAATQGFERTLDDSANRRIVIPDAFLCTEALLKTAQNIFEGMTVVEEKCRNLVEHELPFLALEKVLMQLTKLGKSRQEAHEKIREVSIAAQLKRQQGEKINMKTMMADSYFDEVRDFSLALDADPMAFTGRCQQQVSQFINEELLPSIKIYLKEKSKSYLDV